MSTACRRSFPVGKSAACGLAAARATRRAFSLRRWPQPTGCGTPANSGSGCCSSSVRSAAATARSGHEQAPDSVRFLINGEPTDNRLGAATRGLLRVRLHASGRAAHSSFPELGDSAIDKLLDALMVIRGVTLPDDSLLGRTHYTVGLIEGGVAPNVVSPHASAELLFRTVGESAKVREALHVVEGVVRIEHVLDVDAVRMHTLPGFETAVFPYTTDVPHLTKWGTPILVGPGSIHVAHTDHEHITLDELHAAVGLYESRHAIALDLSLSHDYATHCLLLLTLVVGRLLSIPDPPRRACPRVGAALPELMLWVVGTPPDLRDLDAGTGVAFLARRSRSPLMSA